MRIWACIAAFSQIYKEGQFLLRALLKGGITHPLASRCTRVADAEACGLPGATHSMNVCDWTGQEEEEVDCLSDENRVVYAAQEV